MKQMCTTQTQVQQQRLVSELYLYAVLPTLQELVRYEPEAHAMVDQWAFGVRFQIFNGPGITLNFHDQSVSSSPSSIEKPEVNLLLPSAKQLNNLFTKSGFCLPIPTVGIFKLGKISRFLKLTERLQHYLEPTETDLEHANEEFLRHHVRLSLSAGMRGLDPISRLDPIGKSLLRQMPKGIARFTLTQQKCSFSVDVRDDCIVFLEKVNHPPEVEIEFSTDRIAFDGINGSLDSMAALGLGDIKVSGSIPMAESIEQLMERVKHYV